ncbi:hypothetical protein KSP40_PGU011453 [Platanthera guangdongensis]|uniref:Uncharacterized protein n=1 Tax=Platanthera guangdongensis TaxID=2320717 RepID=A0ABR2LML8_9ASPA
MLKRKTTPFTGVAPKDTASFPPSVTEVADLCNEDPPSASGTAPLNPPAGRTNLIPELTLPAKGVNPEPPASVPRPPSLTIEGATDPTLGETRPLERRTFSPGRGKPLHLLFGKGAEDQPGPPHCPSGKDISRSLDSPAIPPAAAPAETPEISPIAIALAFPLRLEKVPESPSNGDFSASTKPQPFSLPRLSSTITYPSSSFADDHSSLCNHSSLIRPDNYTASCNTGKGQTRIESGRGKYFSSRYCLHLLRCFPLQAPDVVPLRPIDAIRSSGRTRHPDLGLPPASTASSDPPPQSFDAYCRMENTSLLGIAHTCFVVSSSRRPTPDLHAPSTPPETSVEPGAQIWACRQLRRRVQTLLNISMPTAAGVRPLLSIRFENSFLEVSGRQSPQAASFRPFPLSFGPKLSCIGLLPYPSKGERNQPMNVAGIPHLTTTTTLIKNDLNPCIPFLEIILYPTQFDNDRDDDYMDYHELWRDHIEEDDITRCILITLWLMSLMVAPRKFH